MTRKLSKKKARELMIANQIQAAVVGLQIPMMQIPAIYKFAEDWIAQETGRRADPAYERQDRQVFVAAVQDFAISKGAERVEP
jgi:hypothetical protein